MTKTFIETAEGVFIAHFSERGLARLQFPSSKRRPASGPAAKDGGKEVTRWRELTRRALEQALRGRAPEAMPPLDLTGGTEFQRNVWNILRRIRSGTSQTYAEIARTIGRPRAARAVGQACGANPIPVLIPCHRVLAAHGGLGGFSAGLNWKTKLLSREGRKRS